MQVRPKSWITFLEMVKKNLWTKGDVMPGVKPGPMLGRVTEATAHPKDHLSIWASNKVGRAHCRTLIQRNSSKSPDTFSVDLELS